MEPFQDESVQLITTYRMIPYISHRRAGMPMFLTIGIANMTAITRINLLRV